MGKFGMGRDVDRTIQLRAKKREHHVVRGVRACCGTVTAIPENNREIRPGHGPKKKRNHAEWFGADRWMMMRGE